MPAIKLSPKSSKAGAARKPTSERNERVIEGPFEAVNEDGLNVSWVVFEDLDKPQYKRQVRTQREGARPIQLGAENIKTWAATIDDMRKRKVSL
jgi:hypothetical protein